MARILIGWEFGANRGHAIRMAQLGRALRARGHEIAFAVQRIDALGPEQWEGGEVWQAPLTPRLLVNTVKSPSRPAAGLADILARLGMDDAAIVAALLRGWRQLFAAVRPDLVIAEYAPFFQLAARGKVAALAVGTGFQTPPPELPSFPKIVAKAEAASDEAATLAAVNAALSGLGDAPLAALPELFASDRIVTESFAELDPYAQARRNAFAHPAAGVEATASGLGEELFVYAPETLTAQARLWAGLAASGLPVRVHMPNAPAAVREALAGRGFQFEPEPLPIATIAERSRLLVSHGGHGFVCAGLAAGLPHIVCYPDIEKLFYGHALARLRLGGHVSLSALDPKSFGASLKRIHADEAMAQRAREAAPGFRARPQPPVEQAVVEAAEALL